MDIAHWEGVTRPDALKDAHVELRNRFADDAKAYRWSAVLRTLADTAELINSARLGGRSGYTALHQAAHGDAPVEIVRQLVERGAWRTFRSGFGERPYDIAERLGNRTLLPELEPVYRREVPAGVLLRLQSHLHAVIRGRAAELVTEHSLRLPELEVLLELDPPQLWFPIPGMYGGFSLRLEGVGHTAKVISESWCRVVGGSGQRHEITCAGGQLIDEGFV